MKSSHIKIFILLILAISAEYVFGQMSTIPKKGNRFFFYCDGGKIDIYGWDKNLIWVNSENGGAGGNSIGDNTEMKVFSQNGKPLKCEIKMPSDQKLDLKSAGGDIEFHGIFSGNIKVASLSGNIKIENVLNNVELSTGGGDITIGNISGSLRIYETTGNIKVIAVTGRADIQTAGGNIEISEVGNSSEIFTRAGNILTGNLSGETKINTQSGNIKTGIIHGNAVINSGGGEIRIKGAKGNINAYTAGGDMILSAITGTLNAKTEGGKITAELNPQSGTNSLFSSFGEISLALPRRAKAEVFTKINLNPNNWKNPQDLVYIKSEFTGAGNSTSNKQDKTITGTYKIGGEGGAKIFIETTNSSLELRKR
jgi:hypothetical protein